MRLFQELSRNVASVAEWWLFGFCYVVARTLSCGLEEQYGSHPFDNLLPIEPVRVTI